VCGPQECCCEKDVKSKVAVKNGCDGRLKAKILIMTIKVNLVLNCGGEGSTNSPELSLLIFILLAYHHSHFLADSLDFTSFSQQHSWALFLQLGCFGLDFILQ